jgi:two-component system, response regulator, stage 0 sporulation protein F
MNQAEAAARALPCVIVADDDDDIRETLAEVLACEGFHVLEARNGREALLLALGHPGALLLLDHRMPAMTGADVARELRAQAAPVRVVLMTADPHVHDLAGTAGIAHYIAKPFAVHSLLDLIGRVLG